MSSRRHRWGRLNIRSVLQGPRAVEANWLDLPGEDTGRHPVAGGRSSAGGWIYRSILSGGSSASKIELATTAD